MNWIRPFYYLVFAGFVATARAGALGAAVADAAVNQTEVGDVDAAADAVSEGNLARKGSLPWYHQSATVLLGRAEELKVAGEHVAAQKVAAAAIRILQRGDNKGNGAPAADRAQLCVQLATVYDRFFGDHASARQYYQQALQWEPDLASAKAALAAYDAEAARLQQLQGGGK